MNVDEFLATPSSSSTGQSVDSFLGNRPTQGTSVDDFLATPQTILPNKTQITQNYNNYNPGLEIFSGGVAKDTNFAANMGDPVTAPTGNWHVVKAFSEAAPQGSPGDASNSGWGNDVWIKDQDTGHMLHFLHLSGVNVSPGQTIKGGTVVGQTGSSGNATGANLGVEYYDPQGNIGDFMQSPYAQYMSLDK